MSRRETPLRDAILAHVDQHGGITVAEAGSYSLSPTDKIARRTLLQLEQAGQLEVAEVGPRGAKRYSRPRFRAREPWRMSAYQRERRRLMSLLYPPEVLGWSGPGPTELMARAADELERLLGEEA